VARQKKFVSKWFTDSGAARIAIMRLFPTRTRGCYKPTTIFQDFSSMYTQDAHETYCINTSTTTSSPGSTGSTSALSCAATTRDPAPRALLQHCRALRLLFTRPHRLYVDLTVRREYSSPGRSGTTSTTSYAAATSSSGRTTTSTTHLDY
jgi:hypothetical protein